MEVLKLKLADFELSKSLSNLGFPQDFEIFDKDKYVVFPDEETLVPDDVFWSDIWNNKIEYYVCPSLELIRKYLDEEKGILIEITRGGHFNTYHCFVENYIYEGENTMKEFKSYDDALLEGIHKAIKIIKTK